MGSIITPTLTIGGALSGSLGDEVTLTCVLSRTLNIGWLTITLGWDTDALTYVRCTKGTMLNLHPVEIDSTTSGEVEVAIEFPGVERYKSIKSGTLFSCALSVVGSVGDSSLTLNHNPPVPEEVVFQNETNTKGKKTIVLSSSGTTFSIV